MTKDNAFRELKFSPPQLVIVFLAILVLGIFVFLLGISVGKKQPQLLAQAGRTPGLKTESVAVPAAKPADVTTSIAPEDQKTKTEAPPLAEQTQLSPPQTKTKTQLPADKKSGEQTKPGGAAEKTTVLQKESTPAVKRAESKPAPDGLDKKPGGAAVAPEVKKPTVAPKTGYQAAPYYVQVSASEDKSAAAAFAKKIAALGYPTIVLDPLATDKRPVYRVRVGPFESKQDATTEQGKLATALKKKKTDFFIVKG